MVTTLLRPLVWTAIFPLRVFGLAGEKVDHVNRHGSAANPDDQRICYCGRQLSTAHPDNPVYGVINCHVEHSAG
jgi:hypothetical protein